MFRTAQGMERQGRWMEASTMFRKILQQDPHDAHSHLALARLEARRELKRRMVAHPPSYQRYGYPNHDTTMTNNATTTTSSTSYHWNSPTTYNATDSQHTQTLPSMTNKAQEAFMRGTTACPNSVHLWQAWAVFEETCGDVDRARELYEQALRIDSHNPYVCHAYGLMEKKLGNTLQARQLFERALEKQSTAALVCSLGELFIFQEEFKLARDVYARHLLRVETEKDKTEVYLASAWLEERYFNNYDRALELIHLALAQSPGSSLANVALARLEGRIQRRSTNKGWSGNDATARRLANACIDIQKGYRSPSDPNDGRLFNAWANIEVKSRRLSAARKILMKGMEIYPKDASVSS